MFRAKILRAKIEDLKVKDMKELLHLSDTAEKVI